MILKIQNTKGGWIIVSNVSDINIEKNQNTVLELPEKIHELGGNETAIYVTYNNGKPDKVFRGSGEIYIMDDNGRTIERID